MPYIIGFVILLVTSCTQQMTDHYTKNIQDWHGRHVSSLIKRFGPPDERITTNDGQAAYIYVSMRSSQTNKSLSPLMGVNIDQSGQPIVIVKPRMVSEISLKCMLIFIVNAQGRVTQSNVQGEGCHV